MAENNAQRRRLFGRTARQVGSFAMIQPNRMKVSSSALKKVSEVNGSRRPEAWIEAAFDYADQIGEVGFVMNLLANTGSRANLAIEQWNPTDKAWVLSEDDRAIRVMNAFVGPQGGQTELKRRALLHLAIAGESLLMGMPTSEMSVDTGIYWEFLSSEELVISRGQRPRRKRDGMAAEELPDNVYIARMWRSHPRYTDMADSAIRRVLNICQEIVTLTQMVDAAAKSRLSAGLLFVPDEITISGDDVADDSPENDGIDEFTRELMEHLAAPVKDRESAASLVPLVIRGPKDMADAIKSIDLSRSLDDWAERLRREALQRLAAGLDIDPAIMEGKASLNHWTSYNVDVDFLVKHVQPAVDLLADFLTHAYLRPMLEEYEGLGEDEATGYRLTTDLAPLLARSDEGASARVLHDAMVVSDATLVKANGFAEADMPDEEETRRRLALRLMMGQPSLAPALADIVGLTDVDWSKTVPPGQAAPGGVPGAMTGPPPGFEPRGAATDRDATSAQAVPETNPGFAVLVDRLAVAGDAAIERALERAGSRLVTKARKPGEMRDRLATARDKAMALTLVRPDELAAVGLTADVLMDGAWDSLAIRGRAWVRQFMEARGRSPLVADDLAALAMNELCSVLDSYVRTQMHDRLPLFDNGLRVSESLVVNALASVGV